MNGIEEIIKHEGGLVDDKRDRGGMTYKGIARKFWASWEGWKIVDHALAMNGNSIKKANAELKKDSWLHAQVVRFYKKHYWDRVRGDDLGNELGFQVTDCAVNCGIKRAAKMLQKALGVTADGAIGPQTLNALDLVPDMLTFILDYNELRRDYYRSLKQFNIYGRGWLNRVDRNDEIAKGAF